MSLLTLIQTVTDRLALNRLTTVIGNADKQARLLLALANEEGRDLGVRGSWQALVKEQTFTTVATESQGAMTTIITDNDFHHILNNVMWNRSNNQPIFGSITPQLWQRLKSNLVTGPYPRFRVRGGTLRFIPIPAASQTVAFEYVSTWWASKSDATAFYAAWNADTDIGLLDEKIMADGIRWRFLREKGMDYSEEFSAYERLVGDALSRDGGKMDINMGGQGYNPLDPPMAAEGSWNL